MPRMGRVRLSGNPVGIIEETNGATRFTYSAEWLDRKDAMPVSLTLPLRSEPYVSEGLHPFLKTFCRKVGCSRCQQRNSKSPKAIHSACCSQHVVTVSAQLKSNRSIRKRIGHDFMLNVSWKRHG